VTEQPTRLMDAAMIAAELGVSRDAAYRIVNWCADRSGVVVPVDGARKKYVYRADVDAWLEQSTSSPARSAA
jgi:predicted DNA-binding transcriptional regulator AlpA